MNTAYQDWSVQFEAMTQAHIPQLLAIENNAYEHPWSGGNFLDSIQAGYQIQVLMAHTPKVEIVGYFVAMQGVDEVHLLNLTVAPQHQKKGWARMLLDALVIWSRSQKARWLWLEVRASNARAKTIYTLYGFEMVGMRPNYYPLSFTQREDACVMRLAL